MIVEKSKEYDSKTALDEINSAITASKTYEDDTAIISIKPFIHSYKVAGDLLPFGNNDLPTNSLKTFIKDNLNGYIVHSYKKSTCSAPYTLAGVVLSINNKKDTPLVVDINNSAMQILSFYGQPFYVGKFAQQGNYSQPNLMIPPKQNKTVSLFRSDSTFKSQSMMRAVWSGWFLPVEPMDFNNIKAEVTLKVDDKYISVLAEGKIDLEKLQKYDMETQMNADKKK